MGNRVLFYDDSYVFGGHEVMTLQIIKELLSYGDLQIGFMYFEGNKKIANEVHGLATQGLNLYPVKYSSRSPYLFRLPFEIRQIIKISEQMSNINPSLVVLAAGWVEICLKGILSANRAGLDTLTYVPLTQSAREMKARFGWLRDVFHNKLYSLPDGWITITDFNAASIKRKGGRGEVHTVRNGIDTRKLRILPKNEARTHYGVPEDKFLVGLVGRLSSRQKGQDLLIKMVSHFRRELKDFQFLIVGNGPDKHIIEKLIESHNLSKLIKMIDWENDISWIYSALDMLVLPSRFEGFPLVILEAMFYKIPIIASDIEGTEILSEGWRFKNGDHKDFGEKVLKASSERNGELLEKNRRVLIENYTLKQMGESFHSILIERLSR